MQIIKTDLDITIIYIYIILFHISFFSLETEFGNLIVKKELDLVYGYGKTGLMGCVAKAVCDGGRKVTGITPKFFIGKYNQRTFLEMYTTFHIQNLKLETLNLQFSLQTGTF